MNNFYKVRDTSFPPNCMFDYKDIILTVTSTSNIYHQTTDEFWSLSKILSKSPFKGNREEAAALWKSFHRLGEH